MDKDEHYEATKQYMRRSALERDGYYDARAGGPLKHTVWQRRIRRMVLRELSHIMRKDAGLASLLDVGCGRGDFTIEMAERLPRLEQVWGVDFVEETLSIGRAAAGAQERVRFSEGNVLDMPFEDDSFDVVVCINVLHHVHGTDLGRALCELMRVSRRHVILEIKNLQSIYYRHVHPKAFGGIEVYPTTGEEVGSELASHGYRIRKRAGIFGFSWLSPLDVLVAERGRS